MPKGYPRNFAKCNDCKKYTIRWDDDTERDTEPDDYYMVTDEIWKRATNNNPDIKYLCLKCLSIRLNRPLIYSDFANVPVNDWNRTVQKIIKTTKPK